MSYLGKTNGEKMLESMIFWGYFYGITRIVITLGVIALILKYLFF